MYPTLPYTVGITGIAGVLSFALFGSATSALPYAIIAVLIVSIVSFVGLFTLSLSETLLRRVIFILVSVATGALLGDAFIHLVPEAFENSVDPRMSSLLIIGGIIAFFVLEKFLYWHHEHGEQNVAEYEEYERGETTKRVHPTRPVGTMILVSDGFHNFLDGIIIAVSFMAGTEVGIATTIAIILHEIPQEIGDFGVLLHAGFTKARALFLNFISALFAVLGAAFAFLFSGYAADFNSFMLPLAAGGFIYIAAADLIPELHKTIGAKKSFLQIIGVFTGVAAMLALVFLE